MNNLIQKMTPSLFWTIYQKYWKKSGWFGNYTHWEAVERDCDGYDSQAITARVVAATQQVRDGKAAFERDSVLFFEQELDEDLLAILSNIKNNLEAHTPLVVLDFGGALGSTYWQHRSIFKDWNLKWIVVEQTHFVEIGQTQFSDTQLSFAFSIEEACTVSKPQLVLFNSVLQYLTRPYGFFEIAESQGIESIFIGRTPTYVGAKDRIMQQIVPPKIYKASYPSWVFSLDYLKKQLLKNGRYAIKKEVNAPYGYHQVAGKQLFLTDLLLEKS
ncbi:MAG: methyltransferase, TIGR04325 family [Saprospiraceae bacterium]|nr:methyltransferase, TIGR04325 family [Saprospiraceae bacterium]